MRSATRASPGMGKPGLWLALVAVLILLAPPLMAGRVRAEPMRMAMPTAAADHVPCRTCHDPVCASACALSAQMLTASVETAVSPRRRTTQADYSALHLQPAGLPPQPGTPPPR